MERSASLKIQRLTAIGLMTALVFVGNYFQIQIPSGFTVTRFHLGNSMCLLAGLLFCGSTGGIASGIGAALFDLISPAYVLSAPYTFISKFAMGFVAGKLNRKNKDGKIPVATTIIAAAAGQLTYIVLYLVKSFFTVLILGGTTEAAWITVQTNAVTSGVNAILAVVISVPLYLALRAALGRTPIKSLINEAKPSKGYFNPVTVALTVFAFVTATIYAMNLSAQTKINAAQAEEKAALEARLEEYENRLDTIYNELGIEIPEETTPETNE